MKTSPALESFAVAADTVLARCDALAACTDQEGTILRTFLSPAMEHCHQLATAWMRAAGMTVSVDRAGNLRGLYCAALPDAPCLLIASHLDTVPGAGKYDGILGVMLGISLVESLGSRQLPFSIEVIGFSDEEGVRYGLPFIGSRAIVGQLHASHFAMLDADGISLDAALDRFDEANPRAIAAELPPGAAAYLEFHIEQGPVLESEEHALAVVEAIAGQSRATLTFLGRAGHAGTTPMAVRHDAMTAAAEWLLAVELKAAKTAGVVATTGRITCEPGVGNVIPGLVHCSLDLRSASDELRRASLQAVLDAAEAIAARRGIAVTYVIHADQPTVALAPSLTQLAAEAVFQAAESSIRMASGAGHDALILAPHLPTAMIFLRSPGGISHHPEESVFAEDVAAALRAGCHFLEHFAPWVEESKLH